MWGDETPTVEEGEKQKHNSLRVEADREILLSQPELTQNMEMGICGQDTGDSPKHKTHGNNLPHKTGQFPSSRK